MGLAGYETLCEFIEGGRYAIEVALYTRNYAPGSYVDLAVFELDNRKTTH